MTVRQRANVLTGGAQFQWLARSQGRPLPVMSQTVVLLVAVLEQCCKLRSHARWKGTPNSCGTVQHMCHKLMIVAVANQPFHFVDLLCTSLCGDVCLTSMHREAIALDNNNDNSLHMIGSGFLRGHATLLTNLCLVAK